MFNQYSLLRHPPNFKGPKVGEIKSSRLIQKTSRYFGKACNYTSLGRRYWTTIWSFHFHLRALPHIPHLLYRRTTRISFFLTVPSAWQIVQLHVHAVWSRDRTLHTSASLAIVRRSTHQEAYIYSTSGMTCILFTRLAPCSQRVIRSVTLYSTLIAVELPSIYFWSEKHHRTVFIWTTGLVKNKISRAGLVYM